MLVLHLLLTCQKLLVHHWHWWYLLAYRVALRDDVGLLVILRLEKDVAFLGLLSDGSEILQVDAYLAYVFSLTCRDVVGVVLRSCFCWALRFF